MRLIAALFLFSMVNVPLTRGATILLETDATELPRNLLRSSMRIEAAPGPMELYYCIWSPGNHTPSGPIENVIDLRIFDCSGMPLTWDRDPTRVERISVIVPEGCDMVRIEMGYIASQPNTNSRSTDSYGRRNMGVLNWNTALMYPGGKSNQEITVRASLGLPTGWSFAATLPVRTAEQDRFGTLRELDPGAPITWVDFADVPLAELIDSPIIMGQHVRAHGLDVGPGVARHTLAVVAAEDRMTDVPAWLIEKYAAMCRQTMELFRAPGRDLFPRREYQFLVALDESMRFAVEHGMSTLIAQPPRTFLDAKQDEFKGGGRDTVVLAHEYFHAWCGKLAAPEGLVLPDFHTPARTELLWVYEGLTTYYDSVLAVRSGMISFEEFKQEVLEAAVSLEQRTGRLWRSVEDTARSARFLRQRGLYWYDHRRGQEYYGEGAKFWMEADALIRAGTGLEPGGAKSLDDFCRVFFDVPVRPVGSQAIYAREDVVRALAALNPQTEWDALIRARIEEPVSDLGMEPVLGLLGWRIEYADELSPEQKKIGAFEESGGEVNLRTSLGLRISKDAEVIDIVPGSPADESGMGYGMKVIAVDGWVYSPSRLRDAVKGSARSKQVELLVSFGDRIETRIISYDKGPRIPRLVRNEAKPDLLSAIAAPR